MKPLIFTAIVLFIGLAGRGQDSKPTGLLTLLGNSDNNWHELSRKNNDTIIISDTSIHFIKICEQVFEIKRAVTLEPAKLKGWFYKDGVIGFPSYGITGSATAVPQAGITLLNSTK